MQYKPSLPSQGHAPSMFSKESRLTRQTEVDHSVKQVPFSCHTVQHLVQELCREKQRGFVFSGWAFL